MGGRRSRGAAPQPLQPPKPEPGEWRGSRIHVFAALSVVGAGLLLGWGLIEEETSALAPAQVLGPGPYAHPGLAVAAAPATLAVPVERAAEPSPAPAVAAPAPPRVRGADEDQTPDISVFVNPGERPTMAEVIRRLHQAGEYGGLGAFQPPGTRPPLVGLAVPEDFPLPEGYVRHYQATDDGQRIEPILMFSPDRPRLDAQGRPLLGREERVVPPALAPPGLPLRMIVIPPADPGR